MAELLRDYHEAVADLDLGVGAVWAVGVVARQPGEVICHGDFGPWNLVWQSGRPIGIVDWDYARPAPRTFDVAYALEYVAPFRDDAECLRWLAYPTVPDRHARLRAFVRAYGLDADDDWASAVIEVQEATLALARRLGEAGLQPQARWLRNGDLEVAAAKAAWSKGNRHLFGSRG
jgi:aminoglycoside phosphotransferase (APT) family kinase protein